MTHPFTVEQRATLAFADTFRKDVWFEMPGEFVVLKKPTNPPVCVIAVENPEPCPLEGPIDPEYRPYLEVVFDASWTWDPAARLTNRLWIYAPRRPGPRAHAVRGGRPPPLCGPHDRTR